MSSTSVPAQVTAQPRSNFLSQDSIARTVVLSLLLAVATIAVYSPVHNYPFVDLDDPKYVTNNEHIQNGLTPQAVAWAFTHGYSGNYHPLTWVSHAADISIFGMNPAPHHDENIVWHLIDAILLFLVLKRATGYTWRSFMVAALLALHPLNVESVAWIAERKTLLSTFFCLLALEAYRRYAAKPSLLRYAVMTALFVLGLWSKPQIIMLPLVLLLWDYWPLQRMFAESRQPVPAGVEPLSARTTWSLVKEKFPLFFVCLVDAGVTMVAQHVASGGQPFPIWVRLENALVSYTRYIEKCFWPSNMGLYYPHPGSSLHFWQVGGSFLVLAAITVLAARAKNHRYLIVGWLWFLIMLVPMIGIVQVDVQGMADRYAYDSFIGLFIMVCWGLGDVASEQQLPKMLLPAAAAIVLIALSVVTFRQVGYWQDDVTLWGHSAAVTTGNWKAEYMLGVAQDAAGNHDQAAQSWFLAVKSNPTDPFINQQLGNYEHAHRHYQEAIDYYKKVLPQAWTPQQRSDVIRNIVTAYRQMGDYASADEWLRKLNAEPKPQNVDWQGAWWKQIIPAIKQALHIGNSAS